MTNFTADQMALKAFIEQENAEFVKRCKAEGSTPVMITVDDLNHWAEMGVTTIAQYQKVQAFSTLWDMFKDVTGVRPRHLSMDEMSLEDIEEEIKHLHFRIEQDAKAQKAYEEEQKALHQQRKQANAYKPNLLFSGLKDLLS